MDKSFVYQFLVFFFDFLGNPINLEPVSNAFTNALSLEVTNVSLENDSINKTIESLGFKIFLYPTLTVLLIGVSKIVTKLINQGAQKAKDIMGDLDNLAVGYDLMLGGILTLITETPKRQSNTATFTLLAIAFILINLFWLVPVIVGLLGWDSVNNKITVKGCIILNAIAIITMFGIYFLLAYIVPASN
ncbi:MAG: hypothetical protein RM049_27765 [Nostoc sp. DedQUE04]|uniref:hypothetical protein n=1 Tax=Nostoc sp. DedQUE04 TaxID=3075390 RepID=UPI002AD54BC8|nr:hypothetical protein [Nostoc sp. DedQUE04]MDZ8139033.1 hypothetical protein [Nostoc sp. DedQUE04]